MTAQSHQNSRIPRKARNVPLVSGEWFGSILSSITGRSTEIAASGRAAYGEAITATNNARYDAESLLCSVCGLRKHRTLFHRDARNTWRQSRRYECIQCEKHQKIDQNTRRQKRHDKWKRQ